MKYLKYILVLFFIQLSIYSFTQTKEPPNPGGDPEISGDPALGGSAPIGGGLIWLLSMGSIYAVSKIKRKPDNPLAKED